MNYLKPERFSTDPNSTNATQEWTHWIQTFSNFISALEIKNNLEDSDKLKILVNYIAPSIFQYITGINSYKEALTILDKLYKKPVNEIFSRHVLSTRKQQVTENIDQYVQALKLLSRDCNFQSVTLEEHRDSFIRDSFISGLASQNIRQRLLENATLTLEKAVNKARSLESAQKQAELYNASEDFIPLNAVTSKNDRVTKHEVLKPNLAEEEDSTLAASQSACYFCGRARHPRKFCPAKDAVCHKCSKKGHFSKVCRSNPSHSSASITASIPSLSKAMIKIKINSHEVDALIDTGSSESFINQNVTKRLNIKIFPGGGKVSLASTSFYSQIKGYCIINLEFLGNNHDSTKLSVLQNLCADAIIGHDILKQYSQINLSFGGSKPPISICALTPAKVPLPTLFGNLNKDCKPIATKSRKHSQADKAFIQDEVQRLLKEGIIEESKSPWRAQALVVTSENHKKRMVIDYSQTINRFTLLDAYPLPNIEELVSEVSKFSFFSTVDLKSAYHQIPIKEEEKQFTAFEASGSLYQFCRIPFGVTNGVASFQRVIDKIISDEQLQGVFAYLDDVTICGKDQMEHDKNLKSFFSAVEKYGLTLNKDKSYFSQTSICLLGYTIENKTIRPNPDRLKPLLSFPEPNNLSSLRRVVGMFAHYSRFVPKFSEKIKTLSNCKTFPLPPEVHSVFQALKEEIAKSLVTSINETVPFEVETDASEFAIAATLSQSGRPVAFFSRTLSSSECRHSSVEKEAYAIVEALKKWRHYLIGRHFRLITDQKSVAFMFNNKHSSKIKNEKILRWRLELASFSYDIVYRKGAENVVADSFSRICSAANLNNLHAIHKDLCHPGITRMTHWVRCNNLPYSVEDIRKMTTSCEVCAEIKPRFYKGKNGRLIKATSPFERLSIDFKGPLPSASRNHYILTVVDEFSRFPFAYACPDMTSSTVIKHLSELFSVFGQPSYIHSDRGPSFASQELKTFLQSKGIATSHSTPYYPQGNGQVESYNGIIWKSIMLNLRTKKLDVKHWEQSLPQAMNSIRSLLCTSTNTTPHERMFNHPRKTGLSVALPEWLTIPGPVFLKKHVRNNKYGPLVEEVQLVESNPNYATIQFKDGRHSTVSLKHLAPKGNENAINQDLYNHDEPLKDNESFIDPNVDSVAVQASSETEDNVTTTSLPKTSDRVRRQPHYLKDYRMF